MLKRVLIKRRIIVKRALHQPGEVDRAKQTGPIGRQGLLAARVGRRDGLGIAKVVHPVDPVNENHPRLGLIIGRAHDPVPQITGRDRPVDLPAKAQVPRRVGPDRPHKGVGDQHREIEHA